jgi:YD repeat-containing protein
VILDLGDNGESRYSYTAYSNTVPPTFPFAPVESFDWRRGFLIKAQDFVRRGNQLVPVRDVTNIPFAMNEYRIYGLKTGSDQIILDTSPHIPPLPKHSFYQVISEFHDIGRTVERTYDQYDPTKFVEKVISYTYDPAHLQRVEDKLELRSNDGLTKEEVLTTRKYPFDYVFNGTPNGSEALGIKNLQDRHVVDAVVEEFQTRRQIISPNTISNQRVVSGVINTYKPDKPYVNQVLRLENNAAIPAGNFNPSEITNNAFIKYSQYQPVISFLDYDVSGNLLSQRKEKDITTSYLWGHNNSLPIAEIRNTELKITTSNNTVSHLAHQNIGENGTLISFGEPFESFINQTIAPSLDLYVVNGSSTLPSPARLTVSLYRVGNSVPIKTHECTWGSNALGSIALSPGIYQWFYSAQVNGAIGFTGYNLYVTTSYTGQQTSYTAFHTSFEENGVLNADSKTGRKVWSGAYSLNLPGVAGNYKLTYWKKTDSDEWTLIEDVVSGNAGVVQSMNIGSPGSVIDEVRLHPVGSVMTTYTYDPLIGVTSSTDSNQLTTYYEYDAFGRLQVVKDPDKNIVKHYKYHYKDEQ